MKSKEEIKVIGLLLEFSKLESRGREQFLENVNHYMFVSPKSRRKLRLIWETTTRKTELPKSGSA